MQPFKNHTGQIYALDRSDIDTDQIIPKQFLKRVERTGFGQYLFYDWCQSGEIEIPEGASILVTGRNFGCGSSREHAPWALEDFGFRVVVAPSFADIFFNNCTKIGLLPVALSEQDVHKLMQTEQATVDLESQTIEFNDQRIRFDFDQNLRRRFIEGLDDIALTLQHETEIEAFEASIQSVAS